MDTQRSEFGDDVLALASIASPVPLDVVAAVTGRSEEDVAAEADRLAAEGALSVTRSGISGGVSNIAQGRMSVLARRLAEALAERDAPAAQQARARWEAGDSDAAYHLYRQALSVGSVDERPLIVDAALEAGLDARIDGSELADLFVRRARYRRNRGEGTDAKADLEAAIPHLAGDQLVDALTFAAVTEDDLQHPADAERTAAMAMLVAAANDLPDKLGSLSTFHGRVLSRVGFEREADDEFDRGMELIDRHGTATQQFYSSINRAWTDLDRGWVQRAENGFSVARERAGAIEDSVSVADKSIYLARAKFGTGDATGALSHLTEARRVADESGAVALDFLSAIAEAEGDIAFRRSSAALESTARLQEIVELSFPAWANRSATLRARALLLNGDRVSARAIIGSGLAATPPGANGVRIRTELEALQIAAGESWDAKRAADLGDRLVQSGWLGTAAWFLTERCRREKSVDIGRIAAAMAHRLGNPMLAATAIEAAGSWDQPEAGPVSLAIQRIARTVPDEWRDEWEALPEVRHALAIEFEQVQATDADLLAGLDAALTAAGLGDTATVLSPAQRRAAGLVTAPSRAASVARWVAPLVAAAAVAAIIAVFFAPEPPEPQIVEIPAQSEPLALPTTVPELEETVVPTPPELQGQSPFAGGEGRNAVYEVSLGEPTGYYWRRVVTGFVRSDPVLRGKALYVGTSEGWVSAMEISNDGGSIWESDFGPAVESSFASDLVSFDQDGQSRTFVLFSSEDGTLTMRNVDDTRGVAWTVPLESPTAGPPLVRVDYVVAATQSGVLYKLNGSDGTELARYPVEGSVPGGFIHPIAAADGVIYAPAGDGVVKLIDEETMSEICQVDLGAGAEVSTHPVIAEGRWFVGTTTTAVFAFEAGSCSSGGGIPAFQVDVQIDFAPVVIDGVMWNAADELLLPIDISDGSAAFVVSLEATITSPPVAAGDLILIGATRGSDNELIAISRSDREIVWRWPLDGALRTRPVVGDGVVIVATDQDVIAIAVP